MEAERWRQEREGSQRQKDGDMTDGDKQRDPQRDRMTEAARHRAINGNAKTPGQK